MTDRLSKILYLKFEVLIIFLLLYPFYPLLVHLHKGIPSVVNKGRGHHFVVVVAAAAAAACPIKTPGLLFAM